MFDNLWVIGYDDRALLVMGPVLPTAQPTMMRQISKMLDNSSNIRETPMYEKLESMGAPMAMVAQAQALPDQLVALCTLGAPAGTSPNKVLLSAVMTEHDGCLFIDGEPFSFDATVDAALKKAAKIYRPMADSFLGQLPSSAIYTIMANVDGQTFLPLLKEDKQMGAMLSGMGAKVDLDTFIGNIDGTMVFAFTGTMDNMHVQWAAETRSDASPLDEDSRRWLDNNRLTTDGVTVMPEKVRKAVSGRRMATIINLSGLRQNSPETSGRGEDNSSTGLDILPLDMFGKSEYIIFTIRDNNE